MAGASHSTAAAGATHLASAFWALLSLPPRARWADSLRSSFRRCCWGCWCSCRSGEIAGRFPSRPPDMGVPQDRHPESRQRLQRVLVGSLCCFGLLTLLVLVPGGQPAPVAMSNDRDSQTLTPSGLLQPGESHSARGTPGNEGMHTFLIPGSSAGN